MYFHYGFFCLFCPNMLPLKQMTEFSSILTVLALMLIYHTNRIYIEYCIFIIIVRIICC